MCVVLIVLNAGLPNVHRVGNIDNSITAKMADVLCAMFMESIVICTDLRNTVIHIFKYCHYVPYSKNTGKFTVQE